MSTQDLTLEKDFGIKLFLTRMRQVCNWKSFKDSVVFQNFRFCYLKFGDIRQQLMELIFMELSNNRCGNFKTKCEDSAEILEIFPTTFSMKTIYYAIFGNNQLFWIDLLNKIKWIQIKTIFSNTLKSFFLLCNILLL